jgi:hypothetical protein
MLARIRGSGRGSVFVPGDFLDLGSRTGVDFVLHRLVKQGNLRRLARGVYDYPKSHPQLGVLSPSVDDIAKALAGRDHLRIQPSGAYAANLLHLSEQVPAKAVFLTDGPSRRLKVGASEIVLKRTTPRAMAAAGRTSGLVIQGLKYLGQSHVTMERVDATAMKMPRPGSTSEAALDIPVAKLSAGVNVGLSPTIPIMPAASPARSPKKVSVAPNTTPAGTSPKACVS